MKVISIIKAIKEFDGFRYPFNKYGWSTLVYKYLRVPKFKLKLMFHYLKDTEIMSWDMVNCHELVFGMYTMFFIENEEHLMPWFEDGRWQEHKHSENWEGVTDGGSGVKYKDLLEIYMYIKFIRKENEKKLDDLMHLLLSKNAYYSWWEDTDEIYEGEKCVKHESRRLKNFKIEHNYSKCIITDEIIYAGLDIGEGYDSKFPDLYADNLEITSTELETVTDEYNEDFDAMHKIEQELIELDNRYANEIIKIRQYLWH